MKHNFFFTLVKDVHHLFEQYSFEFNARPFMPSAERDFLEEVYKNAKSILEFGSGGSTLFAIENNKEIVSVESDKKFFKYLKAHVAKKYPNSQAIITLAQTGRTGRYGMPFFYPFSRDIPSKGISYVLSGYSRFTETQPDVIFVDGRWRVACCLYSLIHFSGNHILLLDDYENDRGYKVVIEKYFNVDLTSRLAALRKKNDIDCDELVADLILSLNNPE